LKRARVEVESNLVRLKQQGDKRSALYAQLADKAQQLRTLEALQTSNASVVETPVDAGQTQPQPARAGSLGVGLLLGIGLAFLWEAFDTRVRSADEIGQRLRLPLLGRLPEPPRSVRTDDQLVMLAKPRSIEAEAFRVLRTNVEFANLDREARTIMVTSAVQGEGKSTTVANLAVAMARSGKHVILVDLDLRRSYIDRFFKLSRQPGVTDVALEHARPLDAIAPVAIMEPAAHEGQRASNGRGQVSGLLEAVTSGPLPPDPGEFLGTHALSGLLAMLSDRADIVLVDSPPLLGPGDSLTLSAKVDAIIVVTRLNIVRRPMLTELHGILEASPEIVAGQWLKLLGLEARAAGAGSTRRAA